MKIIVNTNLKTGEYTAMNPHEISHVNGYGGKFTVYMRDGRNIQFFNTNHVVSTFIDVWNEALQEQATSAAQSEGATS